MRRFIPRLLLVVVLVAVVVAPLFPQSPTPVKGQADTLVVLKSLDGTPFMGDLKARIAIVEYGDYQCPYCGQHAQNVMPQVIEDYVKTGKARYFFKDTPIEAIHPQALKASQAALCAGEQGKYWEMHDRLFKNQQALGENELLLHADALGLDGLKFESCLAGNKYVERIRKNVAEAMNAGARGTPTFVIGLVNITAEEAKTKPVSMFGGRQSYIAFRQALESLISSQTAEVLRLKF